MKLASVFCVAVICVLSSSLNAQYTVVRYLGERTGGIFEPGVITQGQAGNLLTTAPDQATPYHGTAFRVSTSGALAILHTFQGPDGALPASGLTLGRDGWLYGTTFFGGVQGKGTVFKMTWDGKFQTLHSFSGGNESFPEAPPILSWYGTYYGTTNGGDASQPGAIYTIDRLGKYSLLHTFSGLEGKNPVGALVQATPYWFYGSAVAGGANGLGTLFRIGTDGRFELLHTCNFDTGGGPIQMILGRDGNLYGITYYGGRYDEGVVFKLTPPNTFTVLHHFTGGSDGAEPLGGLVLASDDNLYGVAGGGAYGNGVLFRLGTDGQNFTVLHDFDKATGSGPLAMMQHTNGSFYGATNGGGIYDGVGYWGVLFRFDAGLPPFLTFLDTVGKVGTTVEILGQGFTANTQVFFNGVQAQVVGRRTTYLTVTVPQGATSGPITATTSNGVLTSNKPFLIQ